MRHALKAGNSLEARSLGRFLEPALVSAGVGAVLLLAAGLLLVPYTGDLWISQALNVRHTGATGFPTTALYDALEPPRMVPMARFRAAHR